MKTQDLNGRRGEIQYLTDLELAALFREVAKAKSARDLAIFEVGYHRGLRGSEVGLLEVADLRLDSRRLFVHRLKNGSSGEYPLTDREVRALRNWLRVRGDAPGPLFPSRNRRRISLRRLDELMKRYARAACLPTEKRHFHCLRHSCATSLMDRLENPADVMDHLGHRDIRNTMVYAKVTSRRRAQIGERLRYW